jgi:hypothetical protein
MAIKLNFKTIGRQRNRDIIDWMTEQAGPVVNWTGIRFSGDDWYFRVLYVVDGVFDIEMSFDDELLALEFKLKWL